MVGVTMCGKLVDNFIGRSSELIAAVFAIEVQDDESAFSCDERHFLIEQDCVKFSQRVRFATASVTEYADVAVKKALPRKSDRYLLFEHLPDLEVAICLAVKPFAT